MNEKQRFINIHIEKIQGKILLIRGQKVLLDSDLSLMYEVDTGQLNRAVKRNLSRFPDDFMFQLNQVEFEALKNSSNHHGGRRYAPYVFTEHGTLALAGILKSNIAVEMSIQIVRAFVTLRQILSTHEKLRQKIEEQDERFNYVFKILDGITSFP